MNPKPTSRLGWSIGLCWSIGWGLCTWGAYDALGPPAAKIGAGLWMLFAGGLEPLATVARGGLGLYPVRDWFGGEVDADG